MLLLSAYPIKLLFCAFLFKIVAEFFYFVNKFLLKNNSLSSLFINLLNKFNKNTHKNINKNTHKNKTYLLNKNNVNAIKNLIGYYFFRSVKMVRR